MRERPLIRGLRGPLRERPTVVVMLERTHSRAQRRIIQRAMELDWRIVDLVYYERKLPAGLSPDGALIERLWHEPLARKLRKTGCPVVRVGRFPHPRDNVYPAIAGDLPAAGRLAAEHFAERNFRHVGFIGGQAPLSNFDPMYEAYRKRAVELGAECRLLAFKPLTCRAGGALHVEPPQGGPVGG